MHTFRNVGTTPSRVLFVFSPGDFERFFLEAGEPARKGFSPPEGEPDVERIVQGAARSTVSKYRYYHLLLGSNQVSEKITPSGSLVNKGNPRPSG